MKKMVMMCAVVMSAWAGFAVELWTDPSTGITYKYVVKDDGVKLKGYDWNGPYPSGDYVVPSRIAGLPVVEIGSNAYIGFGYPTSVTIPSSVKRIGDNAISSCNSVVLSEGLTHIGEDNFQSIKRTVNIPASVVEIGERALCGTACNVDPGNKYFSSVDGVLFNKQKTELIRFPGGRKGTYQVPDGVTRIREYAFYCNYSYPVEETLTSILLPKSLQSIEKNAFYHCYSLESIAIPAGVTSIADKAFYECTNLSSIVVEPGNKNYCSVDGILFNSQRTKLLRFPEAWQGSYQIPVGVTEIGNSAFRGCSGLTSVTIPSSVKSIGNSAFAACTGLTSVTIPSSVKDVGKYAFEHCAGLIAVTLPASTKLEERVFYGCRGLAKDGFVIFNGILFDAFDKSGHLVIPNGVTHIGAYFPSGSTSESDITTVTIPSSVKSIGKGAFEVCQRLMELNIPSSVKDIGDHAFSGCKGLSDENGYVIVNGILCDSYGQSGEVVIPSVVTKIGAYSFDLHDKTTGVVVPSTVTAIGKNAFWSCENLESITIPSSVKSIGEKAFYEDDDLTYVYVDKGDTKRVKKLIEESGFDTSDLQFIEGSEPGPVPPGPEPEEGFEEAHTFNGLVYAGEVMCGIVQVTTGKRTAKDQVKVGGFVILTDGKKQTIKSVTEDIEGGKLNVETKAGKLGEMELEITDNGFTGSVGLMTVKSGDIGEDTGIISGTLKMSYFDAKTNKLKTRSIKLGGVASGGEAAGTLETKGEEPKHFEAAIYSADVAD